MNDTKEDPELGFFDAQQHKNNHAGESDTALRRCGEAPHSSRLVIVTLISLTNICPTFSL